jgi:glucose-6-phosphate 1-epimerase
MSWCPETDNEQLFVGSQAVVGQEGLAIRGGVPIIFPQFGFFTEAVDAPGLNHGFARKSFDWRLARKTDDSASFLLVPGEAERRAWPAEFELLYTVSLGSGSLRMTMEVANRGDKPLEFTGCLHTYWKCQSSQKCTVHGLHGEKLDLRIGDKFRGDTTEDREFLQFTDHEETQLMYGGAKNDAIVIKEDGRERLRLTKSNMPDWILWNTGAENGSGIKDLDEGEYKKYICVEPGFASSPVHVAPGATWVGTHEAQLLGSSA